MAAPDTTVEVRPRQEFEALYSEHCSFVRMLDDQMSAASNGMAEILAGRPPSHDMATFLLAMYGVFHSSKSGHQSEAETRLTALQKKLGMGNANQIFALTHEESYYNVYGPGQIYMTGTGFEDDEHPPQSGNRFEYPSAVKYAVGYKDHLKREFIGTVSVRAASINIGHLAVAGIPGAVVEDSEVKIIELQRKVDASAPKSNLDHSDSLVFGQEAAGWASSHHLSLYADQVLRLRAAQLRLLEHFAPAPEESAQ